MPEFFCRGGGRLSFFVYGGEVFSRGAYFEAICPLIKNASFISERNSRQNSNPG